MGDGTRHPAESFGALQSLDLSMQFVALDRGAQSCSQRAQDIDLDAAETAGLGHGRECEHAPELAVCEQRQREQCPHVSRPQNLTLIEAGVLGLDCKTVRQHVEPLLTASGY